MPKWDYVCDECGIEDEYILPHGAATPCCPNCQTEMRRKWGSFAIYGDFVAVKPHDWGKHDRLVCYPDGRRVEKKYNEMYEDGLLGATR